jgi:uncharacterized protein (DUF2235 family)
MEPQRTPSAAPRATSTTHPDNMEYGALTTLGPTHARKKFVLCFDGTGNKFSGKTYSTELVR